MKRIEELFISQWPWTFCESIDNARCVVRNLLGKIIVGYTNSSNARLIAAAPNMYKTEYDLVCSVERLLNRLSVNCADTAQAEVVVAALEAAKKALVKAAGEEVANG